MNCLTGKDTEDNVIDLDAILEIKGEAENMPHRRLEFSYRPCTPVDTTDTSVNCHADITNNPNAYEEKLQEIKDWIGNPNMLIIYNHKKVMKQKFGKERVVLESRLMNQQFDVDRPSFIDSYILRSRLDD
jgi:hypothetical protein